MYKLTALYKQLKEEEQAAQVSQYKIYCDMDGVLCDFDRRFEQFGGMNPNTYRNEKGDKKFWELINDKVGAQFWAKMPWMPEGKQLWEYIKKYKPTLLSAPSEDYSSRYGKKLWVKENLSDANKTYIVINKNDPGEAILFMETMCENIIVEKTKDIFDVFLANHTKLPNSMAT